MKMLSCRDIGSDCLYKVRGQSIEEVISKMMRHAHVAHKNKLENMVEIDRENLLVRMRNKIRETL